MYRFWFFNQNFRVKLGTRYVPRSLVVSHFHHDHSRSHCCSYSLLSFFPLFFALIFFVTLMVWLLSTPSQPFVHGLPERFNGAVAVATADVDEAADLVDAHDVSTIPHFILLRDGTEVCACVCVYLCGVPGAPSGCWRRTVPPDSTRDPLYQLSHVDFSTTERVTICANINQ